MVSISNDSKVDADDIEFELEEEQGKDSSLDCDKTKMTSAEGDDKNWEKPKESSVGSNKFTMKAGTGSSIKAGKGAGLQLQSINSNGWKKITYSLTRGSKTIYSHLAGSGAAGDIVNLTMYTGNEFPVGLGAVTTVENEGSGAISEVGLSVTSGQEFTEIDTNYPGFGTVNGSSASYTFDYAVEPEEIFELEWTFDDYGPDPEEDTEVTITLYFTDLVFGASAPPAARAPVARTTQAKKRKLPTFEKTQTIVAVPKFYVREVRKGGLKAALVLSPFGAFKFVPNSGIAKVTKGTAIPGRFEVAANGDLLVWFQNTGRDLNTVEISGLQIDVGKTPAGPVRLYLKSRKTKAYTYVGIKK